jgi:cell wall-associated NlpC family hydrolase
MITANDIIAAARAQLGTPFRHQGRLPGIALDCAGLAAVIAQQLGYDYREWPGYGRTPHRGLLQSVLDNQPCLVRVPNADRRPGDLLMMRFQREPQHVAICAGETVIHSYQAVGKVCEHALDAEWQARIVAVYRFKDLA